MIGFNKPYFSGNEILYIEKAIRNQKISGNGYFTKRCQEFIQTRYGIEKALLTNSCTDALEMAALLMDIREGDEVIVPAYTFVSTANAFMLRGATLRFADSSAESPNLDVDQIENLVTPRTKAIVVVHYAGACCDMDRLVDIKNKYGLYLVEDAAQAIDGKYKNRPLGSIGDLACFSFHETKNIISGEGGALLVNNPAFASRSEILWEKGTNRSAFFRGEVSNYDWIDLGSSFLPSEITAAFLLAQFENIDRIQTRRMEQWSAYYHQLKPLDENGLLQIPQVPVFCKNNGHIFYLITQNRAERDLLLNHLNQNGVNAISHYVSLNQSPFYKKLNRPEKCPQSERYAECLIRLPMYFELSIDEIGFIVKKISEFYHA